jgi:alpha-beta hydrolase superfamily lysophospholipase
MTTNPEATRMLESDPLWVRAESASFLYQIGVRMRGRAVRQARDVRVPALVFQAERDLSVVPAASQRCFRALGSTEKVWKSLPNYAHDSEFEADRSLLDDEIARWLLGHRA